MKRKTIFIMTFLLVFSSLFLPVLSDCTLSNPCCCADPVTQQKKCYTTGICCLEGSGKEYWDPNSCYQFKIWVEPSSMMFTVGRETPINMYIENLAAYPDNYDITYEIIVGNSALIQVEMSGVTPIENVAPMETRRLTPPRITTLSTLASGQIFFNATSQGDDKIYRNATLVVQQSDLPLSLHELNNFSILMMIFLAGIVYFINTLRVFI